MKSLLFMLVLLMVTGSVGPVLSAEPPVKVEAEPASGTVGKTPTRELSPMAAEINETIETARLEVAGLKQRQEAAINNQDALDIMREVVRVKRECRVEMMRIQLRYARLDGNAPLVTELEDIVSRMTAPPAKGEPIPRNDHQK